MALGDLASDLRAEGIRGPVTDEIIIYLEEHNMAQRIQWEGSVYVQATAGGSY
jgi:hypothetical protein